MIIVFGPAGSGKSTQAKLLAEQNNWSWLSAGELLRNTHDVNIDKIIGQGELAPADMVNKIMAQAFRQATNMDKIVLDGFPREAKQAKWLLENSPFDGHSVSAIIVLDVGKDELIDRLANRGRSDDTPQAIKERFKIYSQKIMPVIDYFVAQGITVLHINGEGTIKQIHERIMEKLSECNIVKN